MGEATAEVERTFRHSAGRAVASLIRVLGDFDLAEEAVQEAFIVETPPDDRLRLIFTCCHPALALDAQVALTMRTLGGLQTPEIARAFIVPEATLAQRLVRAKRK